MGSALDSLINSQVFFPEKRHEALPADYGLSHEEVWIKTPDGPELNAWWIPASGLGATLLFCHGNAGNISHRLDNLAILNRLGLNVLIFDYRGYGKSGGRISEEGFFKDAGAAFSWTLTRSRELGNRLVVFGRSLGGIAAASLAARPEVAGFILESTFTNLGDMARSIYPLPGLRRLCRGRFNAVERVKKAGVPLLYIHGDSDKVVPFRLGKALFEAWPAAKRFMPIKGADHCDTFVVAGRDYLNAIREFILSLNPGESAPGGEGGVS